MVLPGWHDSVVLICMSIALVGADRFLASLPAPVNPSLSWDHQNKFSINVSWTKPAGLDTCEVNYNVAIYNENCPPKKNASTILRTDHLSCLLDILKEDEICVGITTNPKNCENKSASKEVYKDLPPPLALVKNFRCSYYATQMMNCTWNVVKTVPDLQLFYRISKKGLKSCMSYLTSGHIKTGCHMHDEELAPNAEVFFFISGTGETLLINRFFINIRVSAVKPPKPEVIITREGEHLWFKAFIPPFLPPQCLKYKFVYFKCNEQSELQPTSNSSRVDYDIACRYTVQVQVIYTNVCGGEHDIVSDMSEPKYYGEDRDPNLAFKVAMIVTPLIVCCFLIGALLMFRRVKHIILPKIPEPSLFFKDMLNSTSDGFPKSLGGGKLYEPVKETVANHVYLEPKSILLPYDTCI